ncbi:MAG TPA: TldD/PmbA family protein [Firmicutes bacterium]|nr:TldD/PmbA family protein [Bacillota bacterium]HHY98092.1 TldD/PmbA family protein [Bacillota bacterium]
MKNEPRDEGAVLAKIDEALKAARADFVEIRLEESETTRISFRGQLLDEIGALSSFGGCVRALVRGGWGFVSFDGLDDLAERVRDACNYARLVNGERVDLAPVEPVVDNVKLNLTSDPRAVSLSEKKRLLSDYNQIMIEFSPEIQTTMVAYLDSYKKKYYATSEGSRIIQESSNMGANFVAIARRQDTVQQCFATAGGITGFDSMRGLESRAEDVARRAVEMLDARPVTGGKYTVVIDPGLAGVFIHEAFGHLSESDFLYENERLKGIMTLGRRFGSDILNVFDGAAIPGHRGSYKYDDEGVAAQKTYLIKDGILVGRLHSRETAGKMGERPTGNARAINYRHRPIVRMTNTAIEGGTTSFHDMISDIKEGIYAIEAYGGQTAAEMFTFSAMEAFMIRDGKIAERVRDVVLTGNVFETLKNIECIGNDFAWKDGGVGGCGKGGQFPLPVADGGPHVRIRDVVVGGGQKNG